MTRDDKPTGRDAVMTALTDATITLLIEQGTEVSVREIAEAARVNHGLVHTYFGSKRALMSAAFDEINRRAAADLTEAGFPPADLAARRGGELARAVARMRLDDVGDLFTSHPVTTRWRQALRATRPDLDEIEVQKMVVTAATIGLGWAVFADHLCDAADVSDEHRAEIDQHIADLVAELGGIPPSPVDDPPDTRALDDHAGSVAPRPGRLRSPV